MLRAVRAQHGVGAAQLWWCPSPARLHSARVGAVPAPRCSWSGRLARLRAGSWIVGGRWVGSSGGKGAGVREADGLERAGRLARAALALLWRCCCSCTTRAPQRGRCRAGGSTSPSLTPHDSRAAVATAACERSPSACAGGAAAAARRPAQGPIPPPPLLRPSPLQPPSASPTPNVCPSGAWISSPRPTPRHALERHQLLSKYASTCTPTTTKHDPMRRDVATPSVHTG